MRHELKYILTPIQYTLLQSRLKWVMQRDAHVLESGEYFIRSVYFDSPDRLALKEKQNGVDVRRKYRIRFYNGDVGHCRLECKEKKGTRISKRSEALTEEQAECLLFGGACESGGTDMLFQEIKLLIDSEGYAPVVTVDYVREPYVLALSDLRVTFDKEIAWGVVEGCLTHERYLSNIYGDNMVLEVKYNDYLPEHISHILSSIKPVQTAASKYAACAECCSLAFH
ncbi:MAG: polyphosphate polymerase domain-containing protein [Butyrivibrio sp.]|nr:polyphosphate polymerase domain-containing protein [Muribaculum sp.]MCM1551112.1 polyphosphate polymerase domain-containing protein [Butyrivibrio sp.]